MNNNKNNNMSEGESDNVEFSSPLGEWLKRERLAHGWRMRELARRSGVSTTTISDIEKGDGTTSDILEKLAKTFDVSHVYLLRLAGKLSEQEVVPQGGILPEVLRWNAQLMTLSFAKRSQIVAAVDQVLALALPSPLVPADDPITPTSATAGNPAIEPSAQASFLFPSVGLPDRL